MKNMQKSKQTKKHKTKLLIMQHLEHGEIVKAKKEKELQSRLQKMKQS